MVGPDAYIKATSIEIGLSGIGGYEGCSVTASPPPAGMHHRSGTNYFGFVANPQVNAWATFNGDFFTPGAPENGWGFEVGTTGGPAGSNNCNGSMADISGTITSWSHTLSCYSVDWEGNYTTGTNLHFKVNYYMQESDLYYTTTVSITNNTSATIPDMYYYRNVDPDNNESLTGDYSTHNTIVSQPGSGCNLAHVSATQTAVSSVSSDASYLGLAAIGANWRANYGGFSERDGSNIWNGVGSVGGTPFVQTVGSTNFYDEAISLAYRIQNLAPGATETFRFVVILDNASATNAINNLLYFSYPGAPGAPSSICSTVSDTVRTCGGSVPIQVNGSNVSDYTWSWSPATGLSSSTGPSVNANPSTTTTYTATGTPSAPCLSTVHLSVTVQVTPASGPPPVISAIPPVCISSGPVTLTADTTGGIWAGHGITNSSTGTFDPSVAGIGTTLITYSTSGLCSSADSVLITVDSSYNTNILQPYPVCISGSPITLTSASSGGTWNGSGITDTTAGTFDPASAGLGSHQVSYSIGGTCASSDTVTVSVVSQFDASIYTPAAMCVGSGPITLHAMYPGGTWSGVNVTDSTAGTYTPAVAGTHPVIYTISGVCGNTDTLNVTVQTPADVTITPVPPMCLSGGPVNLTADSTGGTWAGAGITNASMGTFNPSTAGLGTHLVTYSTSSTCNTLDSVYITVNSFSDATISQPSQICITATPFNVTVVTPGGVFAGDGITNTSSGTFDPSVAGAGTHLITYSIGGTCAAMDTAYFTVTNTYNTTIINPPAICVGSPAITLHDVQPGGVWSGTGITDSVAGTFTPTTAGTFTIAYAISGGCANMDTALVHVLPVADATIAAAVPVCAGAPAFNLSGATPGGVWTGTGITSASSGTFDPAVSGPGTFTVTYAIGGACGDTATRSITVHALPAPTFTPDATSGCVPLCVSFNESSSSLCSIVHYSFGDGDTSNISSPVHCFDSVGVYSVSITCIDVNGCVGTHTEPSLIHVAPVPVASFTISPDTIVSINTPITFTNTSTGGTQSFWDFGDSTGFHNPTTTTSPVHFFQYPGPHCVMLISSNPAGCTDTVVHCIEVVNPMLMIPNVFTPNGDGHNDVWMVTGEGVRSFHCTIYDRWGMKMKEWDDIHTGWAGDSNTGGQAPDGVYYYVITVHTINSGEIMNKQGYIQLLRN